MHVTELHLPKSGRTVAIMRGDDQSTGGGETGEGAGACTDVLPRSARPSLIARERPALAQCFPTLQAAALMGRTSLQTFLCHPALPE